MLLAGSVSGRPHSKWWWCHDIGYALLAAEHSLCKAPWPATPCRTTSAHDRTMSFLDSAWKPGFSVATSELSALETSWQLRYINSHLPLPFMCVAFCTTSSHQHVDDLLLVLRGGVAQNGGSGQWRSIMYESYCVSQKRSCTTKQPTILCMIYVLNTK